MKWLICFCFMLLTSQQIDKYLRQYDDGKITAKQFVENVRDWRVIEEMGGDPEIVGKVTEDYKKSKTWLSFEDCANKAKIETDRYFANKYIDDETALWFGMISSGLITFDEFKSLIRGRKDLKEMRDLRRGK